MQCHHTFFFITLKRRLVVLLATNLQLRFFQHRIRNLELLELRFRAFALNLVLVLVHRSLRKLRWDSPRCVPRSVIRS